MRPRHRIAMHLCWAGSVARIPVVVRRENSTYMQRRGLLCRIPTAPEWRESRGRISDKEREAAYVGSVSGSSMPHHSVGWYHARYAKDWNPGVSQTQVHILVLCPAICSPRFSLGARMEQYGANPAFGWDGGFIPGKAPSVIWGGRRKK